MSDSIIIDIALGLILFFLVLSLLCSAIQEWIASLFGLRSRNLRQGIDKLLGDKVARAFYEHGLLKSISRSDKPSKNPGAGPSYIEPRLFADIVIDILDRSEDGTMQEQETVARQISNIKKQIEKIEQDEVKEALLTLVREAKGNVEKFRMDAAEWFDSAMDRVSGWYARKVKLWLFIIATVLVVAFNADAIEVGKKLWEDQALRVSLAAIAQETAKQEEGQPALDTQESKKDDAEATTTDDTEAAIQNEGGVNEAGADDAVGVKIGDAETPDTGDAGLTGAAEGEGGPSLPSPADALTTLKMFPIGWACKGSKESTDPPWFRKFKNFIRVDEICWSANYRGIQTWLGWLVSVVACSFGAPFWFGLLSKVVAVRGAGRVPAKPNQSTA